MNPIDSYLNWLKKQFDAEEVDGWVEVISPFLDRNNDHLQFYLKRNADKIIVSDGGQTISNLELSGFQKTDKRAELMATIFRGFQVDWAEDSEIQLTCDASQFPARFHGYIQTLLAIDNLGYLTKENVKSMFLEDVSEFLIAKGITYHANHKVMGKSGSTLEFPFYIPDHNNFQSAYIQLMNNPSTSYKQIMFDWADSTEARKNSKSITLINDAYVKPPKRLLRALEEYEISAVLWSQKEHLFEELVA